MGGEALSSAVARSPESTSTAPWPASARATPAASPIDRHSSSCSRSARARRRSRRAGAAVPTRLPRLACRPFVSPRPATDRLLLGEQCERGHLIAAVAPHQRQVAECGLQHVRLAGRSGEVDRLVQRRSAPSRSPCSHSAAPRFTRAAGRRLRDVSSVPPRYCVDEEPVQPQRLGRDTRRR